MEKTEFTYERFYSKCILAIIMAFAFGCGFALLSQGIFELVPEGFIRKLLWVILTFVFIFCSYKVMKHLKFLRCKGFYWIRDGVVHIQKKNKVYPLVNIQLVRTGSYSAMAIEDSGMLSVKLEDETLSFFSLADSSIKRFSDCDLVPLLEAILSCNPQLVKDDDRDIWRMKES